MNIFHYRGLLLAGLAFLVLLSGCSDSGGEAPARKTTVTEHGHQGSGPLEMEDGQIGVVHLESAGSDIGNHPGSDTGELGADLIRHHVEEEGSREICFTDDDGEPHRVVVKDAAGNVVAEVTAGQGCETVALGKGAYDMEIHHGGDPGDEMIDTVFISSTGSGPQGSALAEAQAADSFSLPSSVSVNKFLLVWSNKCTGCDLDGADLSGAHLVGADLSGSQLQGSKLTSANLSYAQADGVNFNYSDMKSIIFLGAHLDGSSFIEANLDQADLRVQSASRCTFGSNGRVATFSMALMQGDFSLSGFDGCDLSAIEADGYLNFNGATLENTIWKNDFSEYFGGINPPANVLLADFSYTILPLDLFTPANYKNFRLSGTTLTAPENYEMATLDLSGTMATGVKFPQTLTVTENLIMNNTDLSNVDLTRLNLGESVQISMDGAKLEGATLTGMNLSNGSFDNAAFNNAGMVEVDMENASARGAQFRSADMKYASFKNTDLTNAVFSKAHAGDTDTYLDYAYMPGATLDGADLTGVQAPYAQIYNGSVVNGKFQGANLSNAILSGLTLGGADSDMQHVTLDGAVLINSNLNGLNLNSSSMAGAHLEGVDFTGATLYGADLTNAAISATSGHYSVTVLDETGSTLIPLTLNFGVTVFPNNITDSASQCPNPRYKGPCTGDALTALSPPGPPPCVPSPTTWCPRPH